jgi:hypothetical protein
MKRTAIVVAVVCLLTARVTFTQDETIFVDCAAGPGGTGSSSLPLSTIGSAVAKARTMGGTTQQRIQVTAGVCDGETLPILLNVSVRIEGAGDETVVTTAQPPALPPTGPPFFQIIANGVTLTNLRIDGKLELQPNERVIPHTVPVGVVAADARGFEISHLRIERLGQAVRSERSSGIIAHNRLETNAGMFLSGAPAANPAVVTVAHNEIVYRLNGIAAAGSAPPANPVPPAGRIQGTDLYATIHNNDVITTFTDTQDTNPAALRMSPSVGNGNPVAGFVDLNLHHNRFLGSHKYGVMFHGGMPTRRANPTYTGTIRARLSDNVLDGAIRIPALITFTNARATVFPCELDPEMPKGNKCRSITFSPAGQPVHWEYLRNATFDLQHEGELADALIDHPEHHPIDGVPLNNHLVINGATYPFGSFLRVPR